MSHARTHARERPSPCIRARESTRARERVSESEPLESESEPRARTRTRQPLPFVRTPPALSFAARPASVPRARDRPGRAHAPNGRRSRSCGWVFCYSLSLYTHTHTHTLVDALPGSFDHLLDNHVALISCLIVHTHTAPVFFTFWLPLAVTILTLHQPPFSRTPYFFLGLRDV